MLMKSLAEAVWYTQTVFLSKQVDRERCSEDRNSWTLYSTTSNRPHPWLGQRGLTHGWGKEAPPMAGVKRPHPWLGQRGPTHGWGKEASPMAGAKRPHPWLGQRGLTHGWGKEASPVAGAKRPHPWLGQRGLTHGWCFSWKICFH